MTCSPPAAGPARGDPAPHGVTTLRRGAAGFVFPSLPDWRRRRSRRARWAPDISFFRGRITSLPVSSFGSRNSAIGPRPTHARSSSRIRRVNGAGLLRSTERGRWNAIDPNLGRDDERLLSWVSSGRDQDASSRPAPQASAGTHAVLAEQPTARPPPIDGVVEAPTIVRRDGWWYLFRLFQPVPAAARRSRTTGCRRSRTVVGRIWTGGPADDEGGDSPDSRDHADLARTGHSPFCATATRQIGFHAY